MLPPLSGSVYLGCIIVHPYIRKDVRLAAEGRRGCTIWMYGRRPQAAADVRFRGKFDGCTVGCTIWRPKAATDVQFGCTPAAEGRRGCTVGCTPQISE